MPDELKHHRIVAVVPNLTQEDQSVKKSKRVVKRGSVEVQKTPVQLLSPDLGCIKEKVSAVKELVLLPNLPSINSTVSHPLGVRKPVRTPTKRRSAEKLEKSFFLPRVTKKAELASWMPPPPASHLKPLPSLESPRLKPTSDFLASRCSKIWMFRPFRSKSKSSSY